MELERAKRAIVIGTRVRESTDKISGVTNHIRSLLKHGIDNVCPFSGWDGDE